MTDSDNPYASPREPSQGITEPVGPWRDGRFVVTHRHASFPLFCVRDNKPARRAFRCRLTWSYPIDIVHRTVIFDVGLCEACIQRNRRTRWIGWLLVLSAIGTAALLVLGFAGNLGALLFMITVVSGLSGFVLAGQPGVRLKVKRVRGPYFWLRGANHEFVEHLPSWPGG